MKKSIAQFLIIPASLLVAAPQALLAQEFFRDYGTMTSFVSK